MIHSHGKVWPVWTATCILRKRSATHKPASLKELKAQREANLGKGANIEFKTTVALVTLAALPFFVTSAAQDADHHPSHATVEQSTGSGMMAGHAVGQNMMNIIDQVRNDLAALAKENDPAIIHKRIAQDQGLLDQIHSLMSGGTMSGGMMSGRMSGCPGTAPQVQK